jgi:hypothetical protein
MTHGAWLAEAKRKALGDGVPGLVAMTFQVRTASVQSTSGPCELETCVQTTLQGRAASSGDCSKLRTMHTAISMSNISLGAASCTATTLAVASLHRLAAEISREFQ